MRRLHLIHKERAAHTFETRHSFTYGYITCEMQKRALVRRQAVEIAVEISPTLNMKIVQSRAFDGGVQYPRDLVI